MKRLYTFFMAAALCLSSNAATPINVVNGISQELAVSRAAIVGNITYDLTFNIPASKTEAVKGNAKLPLYIKVVRPTFSSISKVLRLSLMVYALSMASRLL